MRIGKIIQALREERDITQKELANKININYSVMNRIESGERPVRDSEIVKIAKVLEVSTDYILGQTSIRNTADKISDAMEDDPELLVFWNNLKEREDLQLLFKQTRDLSTISYSEMFPSPACVFKVFVVPFFYFVRKIFSHGSPP